MLDTDIVYHELKYMKLTEYKNFAILGWSEQPEQPPQ